MNDINVIITDSEPIHITIGDTESIHVTIEGGILGDVIDGGIW
jgi:hypothetical protein